MSRKHNRKYNGIRAWAEYGAVMTLVVLFRILPWRAATALASGLTWFLFYLIPKRRKITLQNLRQAFGRERSERELYHLAKACYRNLAYSIVEFSKMEIMSQEEIASRVKIEGAEHLEAALAEGRGVIGITSHLGNWELLNAAHAIRWRSTHVLGRPLDNSYLDRFVNRQRERFGGCVINSKSPGAIREILKVLGRGSSVGFLMDQNVRGDRGVFVDFLGRLAYTHKVVALVAERTGAPVIPTYGFRQKDGTHRLVYGEPLKLAISGERDQNVVINTQRMTRAIEGWIRAHPEQWLWMHDRWKKQPGPNEIPLSERAVFLDRDGTITEEVGYVDDLGKFRLMKHSAEAIRLLKRQGLKAVVVTNQSGVARGFFPESHVQNVNRRLEELLSVEGVYLDGIYYCPHHPTEGQGSYTHPCDCRKPGPGLLYRAEQERGIRLSQSYVVGDKLSDMELAHRVGAKGILVLTGYGREELERGRESGNTVPDHVAEDLLSAAHWIFKQLGVAVG